MVRPPWLTLRGWLVALIPFAFTLGMIATGCPKPPPGPVTPPDASDAAPAPDVSCADACSNLERLGCSFSDACPEICARIRRPSYRACVAAAVTCRLADSCGHRR